MLKVKSTPIFAALVYYCSLLKYHIFVNWGGRGSGKSHSVIEKLVLDFVDEDRCNYLFGLQNSARVNKAFLPKINDIIRKHNLDLKVTTSPLEVTNQHGFKIFCMGFDDKEKAKEVANIGKSMLDEIPSMPMSTIMTVMKTTREIEDWELHLLFNPISPDNHVKTEILDNPWWQDRMITIHSTCEDNPFLPESVKDLYRSLEGNERDVDYLGKFGTNTSKLVFGEKLGKVDEVPDFCNFLAYGLDYSNGGRDPHSLVELWYGDESLYVKLIYQGHCPIDTIVDGKVVYSDEDIDLHNIIKNRCTQLNIEHYHGWGAITADRANPANTNKLYDDYDINVFSYEGAYTREKGRKAVDYFKRIYVVKTEDDALRRQLYNYKLKVDKMTDRILSVPDDKGCEVHAIDALFYAAYGYVDQGND